MIRAAIENAVRPETGMISVMLANNEVGTIQPISEIAKVAHMHGALMHTDAVQAVGHIPVDVEALDVDLLSISAHKFCGPKGIGALYIRNGVKMTNLIYGGEQERGLRAGTENTPAIVGMAKRCRFPAQSLNRPRSGFARFETCWKARLRAVFQSNRQRRPRKSPAGDAPCNVSRRGHQHAPDAAGYGGHCGIGGQRVRGRRKRALHVIRAMRVPEGADVRFSLGNENDETQIRQTVDALCRVMNG